MANISLPEETLNKIFKLLAATDRSSLLAVALTCRQFRRITTPFVFESVFVSGDLLCGPLLKSELSFWIKKITLKKLQTSFSSPVTAGERAGNFDCALCQCRNLEVFVLGESGEYFPCKDELVTLALRSLYALRKLRTFIDYSGRDIFKLLPPLSQVTRLALHSSAYPPLQELRSPRTHAFPNLQHLFLRNFPNHAEYLRYFRAVDSYQVSYGGSDNVLDNMIGALWDPQVPRRPSQTGVLKLEGDAIVDFSMYYHHRCRFPESPSLHLVLLLSPVLSNDHSDCDATKSATNLTISRARQFIHDFEPFHVKCSFVFQIRRFDDAVEPWTFDLKLKWDIPDSDGSDAEEFVKVESEKLSEAVASKAVMYMNKTELVENIERVGRGLQSGEIDGSMSVALDGCLTLKPERELSEDSSWATGRLSG